MSGMNVMNGINGIKGLNVMNGGGLFKNVKSRMLIFLVFCIGARFGLAYLAKNISNSYLTVYSLIIGIIGVSFLFLSVTGLRKTGAETGGNPIWWGHLRPIHGILYVLAGGLLFYRHRCWGSQVIVVDTLIGLTAFLLYHLREGDIKF